MALKNSINNEKLDSIIKKTNILSKINLAESISNYTIFLVNDIINYSTSYQKIKNETNIEKIDIGEIIKFCKNILKSLLITKEKNKYIEILNENDPLLDSEGYIINSDPFRIQQILLNFLSNSVKFTNAGFIKLKTEILTEEKSINNQDNDNLKFNNTNILKISVIDSSVGLEEEEIKNIFKSEKNFSKKDYNKGGSGLGLSISKNIADKLNHKIEVLSVLGYGSEFSINLECNFPQAVKKYYNFFIKKNNSSHRN